MVTITKADQDYILAGHLIDVRLTIVPAGTNKQHIVKGFNIVDGSCSIDRNIMSGTDFSLGNVESAELRFSLINEDNLYDDIVFEGAQVTFELDIDGTLKQLGIFTIDQRPTRADFMHIRALDNMAKFDRKATIIGSKTLKQLVQDACYACGVVQNVGNFPNHGVTVPADTDIFDDCTYRDIISWVAAMSGRNAIIAPDGRLEFRFVEMTDMEISREAVDVFVTAEKQVTITGVEYNEPARTEWNGDERQEIPEQQWLVGDEGYTIDLSDNPILGVLDDIETPLGVIGSGTIGFTYLPIASLTTVGLPHIEPGDTFTVIELDYIYPIQQVDEVESNASYEFNVPAIPLEGDRVGVYVTHHRWVANSQSFIKSAGETEAEKGYATGSELTPSQKAQITRIIERRQPDMENMLTVFEEAQVGLHNEIANALGFYTTEKTDPETGRKKVYIHDELTLETSQYIEVRTGPGSIAWTTTGWNDGNPDWQTGVTKDGSMVMQIINTVKITAENILLTSGGNLDDLEDDVDTLSGHFGESGDFTILESGYAAFVKRVTGSDPPVTGDYSATTIDGGKIKANTVTANQINVVALDGTGELYSTGGTLKLTQTGVGTLEISPTNPLKVTDSLGAFIGGLITVNGKLYLASTGMTPSDNSDYVLDVFEESKPWDYAPVGSFAYGTGAGLRCYDLSGSTPRLTGSITYMSKDSLHRQTEGIIISGGTSSLSISNNEVVIGIPPYENNWWINGPILKFSRGEFFLKNDYIIIEASNYGAIFGVESWATGKRYGLVLEPSTNDVYIQNNGNRVIGSDTTGPYFTYNGSTTYFHNLVGSYNSNSNGEYITLENGLTICMTRRTYTQADFSGALNTASGVTGIPYRSALNTAPSFPVALTRTMHMEMAIHGSNVVQWRSRPVVPKLGYGSGSTTIHSSSWQTPVFWHWEQFPTPFEVTISFFAIGYKN